MSKILTFDTETNGLLHSLDRLHLLTIKDEATKDIYVYRRNSEMDNIAEGVAHLETADELVGHNIIQFDLKAIKKVYPNFAPKAKITDTLVLCRVVASNIKDSDFKRWKEGRLPGNLIGSHTLEAWGYRLNKHKGDYAKLMKEKGLDPWAEWNPDMEDYGVNDTIVTSLLWNYMRENLPPEKCSNLETQIHTIAGEMEEQGFPFDVAAAITLAEKLQKEGSELRQKAIEKYGSRLAPAKKKQILPYFYDPDGVNEAKLRDGAYKKPVEEYGEDYSRKWWGDVTISKVNRNYKGMQYSKGLMYCKAKWVEFNPTSRQQIIERLVEDHGWEPEEFTETGQPSLSAPVLETLEAKVPSAKDFGELFFNQKILGQLSEGTQSWIKNYNEETGCVHTRTNTGGAVTGRCTHSNFNIGQIPSVMVVDVQKNGQPNTKLFLENTTTFHPLCFREDGSLKKKAPVLGRAGEYGWECRSLFHAPEGWVQVGVDLSGIEFRCLAELTADFDGGELIEVVLNGDIHQFNMDKTGIPTRDIVKRVLYGLLYGAGDEKLGYTAKPTATPAEAKRLGAELRAQLMAGLPALKKAIDKVKKQAGKGYLIGIDGRKLKVRSTHSALNTTLQSAAALIAKKWVCITRDKVRERGWIYGWQEGEYTGDISFLAFVHDELQAAVAPDYADEYAKLCVEAAAEAGKFFGFRCPVGAEAKIGKNWAECH